MNTKEMIADTILNTVDTSYLEDYGCVIDNIEEIAEALLALQYDCPECNGRGKSTLHYTDIDMDDTLVCDTCKGTGKGLPVLAVRNPDQTLPDIPTRIKDYGFSDSIYEDAQIDMLSQGWKKTIEE
jgi:hypothetical protein